MAEKFGPSGASWDGEGASTRFPSCFVRRPQRSESAGSPTGISENPGAVENFMKVGDCG